MGLIFLRIETRTYLKDCHPDCVNIRAHGGEPFQMPVGKPELLGMQQLWCHPPGRAPYPTVVSGAPGSRFINNRGESKVRQASTTFRIDEDVSLVTVINIRIANFMINR